MRAQEVAPCVGNFLDVLANHFASLGSSGGAIQSLIQKKAWERALEFGPFPEKGRDGFHYCSMDSLKHYDFSDYSMAPNDTCVVGEDIKDYISTESIGAVLVFVNGVYSSCLSQTTRLPKDLVVMSLEEALPTYGAYLQENLVKTLQKEKDPFVLLNLAFLQNGVFLYVPEECVVNVPIQCIHLVSASSGFCFPQVHLALGKGAKLSWNTSLYSIKKGNVFYDKLLHVSLDCGAQLSYTDHSVINSDGWFLGTQKITQKQKSVCESVFLTSSASGVCRNAFHSNLIEQEARFSVQGVNLLSGQANTHNFITVSHEAESAYSFQHVKNIMMECGRASFEGKIIVQKVAQKTEAYQLNNNLILEGSARAQSHPGLEIHADDVQASHGSTTTTVDEDALFYLQARGIAKKKAKWLLVQGFAQETFLHMKQKALQCVFANKIQEFLDGSAL